MASKREAEEQKPVIEMSSSRLENEIDMGFTTPAERIVKALMAMKDRMREDNEA